jgi:hypothetical protein
MIQFGCQDEVSLVSCEISFCGGCGSVKWELVKGPVSDAAKIDAEGEVTTVCGGVYRWACWSEGGEDTGVELVAAHAANELLKRLGVSQKLQDEVRRGFLSVVKPAQCWE